MLKNSLNGLLVFLLMLSYVNRGLFVDMSEGYSVCLNHISQTKNEINSVLEFIFELTGNANDIDEDGDSPESYSFSNFTQPFVCQDFTWVLEQNIFAKDIKSRFYIVSDVIFSLSVYGQIDHPPEG